MVFSKYQPASEIKKGQIITVNRNVGEGTITHRVVDIKPTDAKGIYDVYLKGDANDNADPDPYRIPQAQVYMFHVAVLGHVASLVQTQFGISLAVLLGAVLLLFFIFPGGYKKVTTEGSESDVSTVSSGNQAAFPVNTPPAVVPAEKINPLQRLATAAKGFFATKPKEAKALATSSPESETPKVLHPGQVGATVRANDAMQGLPSAGPSIVTPEPTITVANSWVESTPVPDYSQTTAMASAAAFPEPYHDAGIGQTAPERSSNDSSLSIQAVSDPEVLVQHDNRAAYRQFDAIPPRSPQLNQFNGGISTSYSPDIAAVPQQQASFAPSNGQLNESAPRVTDPATFAAKALAAAQALQQAQAHVKAIAEAQSAAEAQARIEAEAAAQAKAAAEAIAQARAVAQARAAAEEHLRQEAIARMEAEAREHAAAEQRRQQQEMLARAEAEAQERARIAAAEQAQLAAEAQAAAERQAVQYRAAEHAARVAAEAQATAEAQAEAARFAVAQAESAQFAANAAAQAAASQHFAPHSQPFSQSGQPFEYRPYLPAATPYSTAPVVDPYAGSSSDERSGIAMNAVNARPTVPAAYVHAPSGQYVQPAPMTNSLFHPASVSAPQPQVPDAPSATVYQPAVLPDQNTQEPVVPATVSVPFVQTNSGVPTPESVTVPRSEADIYPEPAKASSHAGAQYGQNMPFSSIHTHTDSISVGETSVSAVQRSGRHGRLR
ncbi:hypothetical protein FHX76_001726 [Lysinibacter cavernae]|uniref:Signal peptidase I n=2 Tax=Lysinibacter cavernae TaxID=1640652 RepID=A0A7X5TU02_9MICO|nr:hypothetical protein [Lysinibacter cavernae]